SIPDRRELPQVRLRICREGRRLHVGQYESGFRREVIPLDLQAVEPLLDLGRCHALGETGEKVHPTNSGTIPEQPIPGLDLVDRVKWKVEIWRPAQVQPPKSFRA